MESWNLFLSRINKIVEESGQDIINESNTQYYTTCPDCKQQYISDETHLCQSKYLTKEQITREERKKHA